MDWQIDPLLQGTAMRHLEQASILVVDFDVETLYSIASLLLSQDHRVLTARDSSTAYQIGANEELDLLITDLRIGAKGVGEESGLHLASSIKASPSKCDLPVMFTSANQAPGVIRRNHAFGTSFHVRKPIDTDVILELVEQALWLPHLVESHLAEQSVPQPHMSIRSGSKKSPVFPKVGTPHIFADSPVTF
jgi:CheY-like chemotaxis protein